MGVRWGVTRELGPAAAAAAAARRRRGGRGRRNGSEAPAACCTPDHHSIHRAQRKTPQLKTRQGSRRHPTTVACLVSVQATVGNCTAMAGQRPATRAQMPLGTQCAVGLNAVASLQVLLLQITFFSCRQTQRPSWPVQARVVLAQQALRAHHSALLQAASQHPRASGSLH